ncbi:MAG: hypothetical protein QXG12_00815 [Thermoproteota archaeon]
MGVRVRMMIVLMNNRSLETVALANAGFESPGPQLLLPVKAAEKPECWV